MASCVTDLQVICWDDLGPESVKKLTLHELPLIVAIHAQGNDAFQLGQRGYLNTVQ
jgi:fumarate hydratase subunit beta